MGCYAGKKEYMDYVAPLGQVYQAGTLSANPVGMVAGLATLKMLEQTGFYENLENRTAYLSQGLNRMFAQKNTGLHCAHFGSLFWVHAATLNPIRAISEIPANQGESFKPLFLNALEQGVYLAPNAYEVGFMSTAHDRDVLDATISKLQAALSS